MRRAQLHPFPTMFSLIRDSSDGSVAPKSAPRCCPHRLVHTVPSGRSPTISNSTYGYHSSDHSSIEVDRGRSPAPLLLEDRLPRSLESQRERIRTDVAQRSSQKTRSTDLHCDPVRQRFRSILRVEAASADHGDRRAFCSRPLRTPAQCCSVRVRDDGTRRIGWGRITLHSPRG